MSNDEISHYTDEKSLQSNLFYSAIRDDLQN